MSEAALEVPVGDVGPIIRRPKARRRALVTLAVLAVAAMAALYGWQWWTVARFRESTDDAYVGGDVTAIAPKVSGVIARVAVVDNQAVKAGDVLVQIDDRDYRAALARSEAAISAALARLTNAQARDRLQRAVIEQAEAEILATEAEVERSRVDSLRYRALATSNAASIQLSQRASADALKALSADRRAKAALDAARLQLAVIATERAESEAALAQARAERDIAALNVEWAQVRSPVDGTVGNRGARVGGFATAGAQLLAIVPARGLWVDANFKETQLRAILPGMAARIEADAAPGRGFPGRVGSLSPATGSQFAVIPTENATGNFTKIVQRVPVRILLDGDAGALGVLRPGLSVTAEVDTRRGGDVR